MMPFLSIVGGVAAHKAVASIIVAVLGYVTFTAWQRPEMLLTVKPLADDEYQIEMISVDSSNIHRTSVLVKTSKGLKLSMFDEQSACTRSSQQYTLLNMCACPNGMLPLYEVADSDETYICRTREGAEICMPTSNSISANRSDQFNYTKLPKPIKLTASATRHKKKEIMPVIAMVMKSDENTQIQIENLLEDARSPSYNMLSGLKEELDIAEEDTSGPMLIGRVNHTRDATIMQTTKTSLLDQPAKDLHSLATQHFVKLLLDFSPSNNKKALIIEENNAAQDAERTVAVQITSESTPISEHRNEVKVLPALVHVISPSKELRMPLPKQHTTDADQHFKADKLVLIQNAFIARRIAQQQEQQRQLDIRQHLKILLNNLQQKMTLHFKNISQYLLNKAWKIDVRPLLEQTLNFMLDVSDFVTEWINFRTLMIVCEYAESFWRYVDAVLYRPAIKILRRVLAAYSVDRLRADVQYLRQDFVRFVIICRNLLSIWLTFVRRFHALCLFDQMFCLIPLVLLAYLAMLPFFIVSLPVAELFVRQSRAELARLKAQLEAAVENSYDECYADGILRLTNGKTVIVRSFHVKYNPLRTDANLLSKAVAHKNAQVSFATSVADAAVEDLADRLNNNIVFDQSDDSIVAIDKHPPTPPFTDSGPSTPQHDDASYAVSDASDEDNESQSLATYNFPPDFASDGVDADESFQSFNDDDEGAPGEFRVLPPDVADEVENEQTNSTTSVADSSLQDSTVSAGDEAGRSCVVAESGAGDAMFDQSSWGAGFYKTFEVDKNSMVRTLQSAAGTDRGWDLDLAFDNDEKKDDLRIGSFISSA